ncbi:tRNA pseudouridine(55) synthase TruB [Candidatus Thioglobus sp.]|jgi:tRNA pseudouridine55 synthase|uniref:tRNA pseudouridine(55) synthase TruB n=1 Tax=Candidatus Thioglobus sp. TaxID=2026721 RepID=UPI001D7CDDEF|nr:tRNA pseudouridine(55) synthase TruB [Candidatus Thioglobus sp.]MBT3277436.1 tRNA pseudouridine(55) synthase TruB [Candidatus Thioglobus sp.]MBT3447700.1 tRNA pseudouridine(55) synthase TruB [Candidatus Thioglobus sp.]MBT3744610.1 tRNA pseudouridine(55) synthase TruB [Candidatus Thioglobus sp.]MBT4001253.1 tRNA pseudouridine(55) synthase TruB [Candidatus Thioglobus sp.]MBT4182092.1 tRNA pseudouridine(55) synthase TruB [Candidatus Thioglobus sp.]
MSRRNPKGRDINGIVLLDKDTGLSSNAALQKVKRLFFAKKAGHTGSLDPLASGILPICLGQATKVAQFLLDDDKRYFVRGKLGEITDTGDCEGVVTKTQEYTHLDEAIIKQVAMSFVGDILQVPPMYSALKKDGQPLYKLARQGIEIERPARPVTIHAIEFISYEKGVVTLDVSCSKGTYIRSLIQDIGDTLGCGAHVIELRRTGFAHIDISKTLKFSELEALSSDDYQSLDAHIFPSEDMLPSIQSVTLVAQQSIDIKYGRTIQSDFKGEQHTVKLFDLDQQFLGIGELTQDGVIAPKRLFV